jgi:hypothetical protein
MKGVMKVNTEMGRLTEEPNDIQRQAFVVVCLYSQVKGPPCVCIKEWTFT